MNSIMGIASERIKKGSVVIIDFNTGNIRNSTSKDINNTDCSDYNRELAIEKLNKLAEDNNFNCRIGNLIDYL